MQSFKSQLVKAARAEVMRDLRDGLLVFEEDDAQVVKGIVTRQR